MSVAREFLCRRVEDMRVLCLPPLVRRSHYYSGFYKLPASLWPLWKHPNRKPKVKLRHKHYRFFLLYELAKSAARKCVPKLGCIKVRAPSRLRRGHSRRLVSSSSRVPRLLFPDSSLPDPVPLSSPTPSPYPFSYLARVSLFRHSVL